MREQDVLKICYLFYKEGKTQVEIADLLGLSRFKVSRILKDARERQLVTVQINHPRIDLTQTEVDLAKRFGLRETVVVHIDEFSGVSALDQVGMAGAEYLRSIVTRAGVMGVTWGTTVYHVISHLKPIAVKDLTLVQIGGGLGTIEGTDNHILTLMLGQKLGARAHVIPAPVIVRNRAIRDTLFKEKKIRDTLRLAKKADLVLFGVGLVGLQGLLWQSGFLDEGDARKLHELGAVGAICGRFFDAQGRQCWHELDDRTIGLNLDELKRIKHKVLVATGREKLRGIQGALRGGLLDVLVTDRGTAEELLKTVEPETSGAG